MTDYDFTSPAARVNPQRIYNLMREEAPVYRLPEPDPFAGGTAWVLTRYRDCEAVLKNKEAKFGRNYRALLDTSQPFGALERELAALDPPDHTRLRDLARAPLVPRAVQKMRPRVEKVVEAVIDALPASGEIDLLKMFALPVSMAVIGDLLGVPAADRARFRTWVKALRVADDRAIETAFDAYMDNLLAARRAAPGDDMLSMFAAAMGDEIDRDELPGMFFMLYDAGHDNTANLIVNGILALFEHPDQMQKLKADPAQIRTAVSEMARYNGPVDFIQPSYALEDTVIGEQALKRGDALHMTMLGANRDPEVFDNPNLFDIARYPNKHLAFGIGPHLCLGMPLARLEAEVAINAMLAHRPNLALAVEPAALKWNADILFHGVEALPVRL